MEGNNKAMREACQKMRDLLMLRGDGKSRCILTWDEFNESQKMLRAVLSAPPRNCDVGTAEEQLDRYGLFCQNKCPICDNRHSCHICGERYRMKCMMKWAQMPYEANEKGNSK